MKSETIDDLQSYISHIELFGLISEPYLFRGQPVQGDLLPGIARKNNSVDTSKSEKESIDQLKLMGASFLPGGKNTKLDILVLAQHHGLKTRLLDWTSNPLAALWFACADSKKGDVYVYALDARNLRINDVYNKSPFRHAATRVFQPRLNNPNIIAQHGWFTLHRYSRKSNKFVPLEKNQEVSKLLTEFRILDSNRKWILESLDQLGIGHRTLFPDLGGLCLHLNWKLHK